ncbi:cytochrome P450 4C1-like [Euwallacea similis]|uniref:cytochrome P450 4C1-like n=1 Tax=Euwallacea similis TaxID=1736056 RepID=UPI00344F00E5
MFASWQVLCVATIVVVIVLKRWKVYLLSWQLPGPTAYLPIIGNGLTIMCDPKDMLTQILKMTDSYSSPLRIWIGPKLVVFVKDPDQLQTIMQSSKFTEKSFVYRFLKPFLGKGLFTSKGLKHKAERKLLQHLFGPKFLEGYSKLFQKHAKNLVQVMENNVGKGTFDVLHILHNCSFEATLDIIVEHKNDHTIDYTVYPELVRRFYYIFTQRIIHFWMHWDLIYKLTGYFKEEQEMRDVVLKFSEYFKNQRMNDIFERVNSQKKISGVLETREIPSVVEMMIQILEANPECFTEKEFVNHVITFIATSQDTQSSTIAFTLMMLGIHKSIQDNVLEELKNILGDNKELHLEDINKLQYLEMCIKESLRLFPLGPFLPRDVMQSFNLGKWTIPTGCAVVLGVYNVHRDPKHWEKPGEFYPEHFTREAVARRHAFAFLPFSNGPRRCIAQQYSYVNMKIIIANLLLNYEVECPFTMKNLKLTTDVSIRPVNGYMINISKRVNL